MALSNYNLEGTIGGIYDPFKRYVRRQLNIRKALIAHSSNVKTGKWNWKYGQDTDGDGKLSESEVAWSAEGTWDAYAGDNSFSLDSRGLGVAQHESYYNDVIWPDTSNVEEGYILNMGYTSEGVDAGLASDAFYTYTVEKQAFIRMISGVDVDNLEDSNDFLEDVEIAPYDGESPGAKNFSEQDVFSYKSPLNGTSVFGSLKGGNPNLASAWILHGGAPFSDMPGFKPGMVGSTYGDPVLRANPDNDYGIVPMPGIVDAEIRTKGKYGALREAVVKFECHNRRQLDVLETLYMRPGHYVALEWGWTPYIDNNFQRQENTVSITYDFLFPGAQDVQDINKQIIKYKEETSGNYDGFIGIIKNFSYKVREDGGYNCTTELMAGAELMESFQSAKVTKPTGRFLPTKGDFELETLDSLLYYFRSIKKNLNKAADAMYIKTPKDEREYLGEGPITALQGSFGENIKEALIVQFKEEGRSQELLQAVKDAEFIGDRCPAKYKGLFLRSIDYSGAGIIKCAYNILEYDDDGDPQYTNSNDTVVNVIPYNTVEGQTVVNPSSHIPTADEQQTYSHDVLGPSAYASAVAALNEMGGSPRLGLTSIGGNIVTSIMHKYFQITGHIANVYDTMGWEGAGDFAAVSYQNVDVTSFESSVEIEDPDNTLINDNFTENQEFTDATGLEAWTSKIDQTTVLIAPELLSDQVSAESTIRSILARDGDDLKEQDLTESKHYKQGLDDIIALYKYINKKVHVPSEDHAMWQALPTNLTPYGFNSEAGEGLEGMLGNSIVKQIIRYPGEKQLEELKDTGYRKNIYVRWDLICQIINHLALYKPDENNSYESWLEHNELRTPLIELTYMNENQNVWANLPPSTGRLTQYEGNKYYLRYSVPSAQKTDPGVDLMDPYTVDPTQNLLNQPNPGRLDPGQILNDGLVLSQVPADPQQQYQDLQSQLGRAPTQQEFNKYKQQKSYEQTKTGPYHQQIGSSYDHRVCLMPHMPIFYNMFQESRLEHDESFDDEQYGRGVSEEAPIDIITSYELKDEDKVNMSRHSIGLIYFNLDYLIETYEKMRLTLQTVDNGILSYNYARLNTNFNLLDFVKTLWDGVNDACAYHYNFGISTEHERPSKVRIVDHHLSGPPPLDKIFTFEPQGLRSVTRDFFYNSKITSKLSSNIAIAALDPNSINNVESLGFKSFNKHIISRFTPRKNIAGSPFSDIEAKKLKEQLEKDIEQYTKKQKSLNFYLFKLNQSNFVVGYKDLSAIYKTSLINHSQAKAAAQEISELRISILNRYPLSHEKAGQWRQNTTHHANTPIPLHVNLMLDGIAGLYPFRLFQVIKSRLPIAYRRDDIGFIVTRETQKITSGQDWTVSIQGDFVIMDINPNNDGFQYEDTPLATIDQVELDDIDNTEDNHEAIAHLTADNLTLSEEGLTEIIGSEAFRQEAYKDTVDVWTIGIGQTYNGVSTVAGCEFVEGINPNMTREEAFNLIRPDERNYPFLHPMNNMELRYGMVIDTAQGSIPVEGGTPDELVWPTLDSIIGGGSNNCNGPCGGPPGTQPYSMDGNATEAEQVATDCVISSVDTQYGAQLKGAMRHWDVQFTQNEYDAMISFVYNVGLGGFKCGSRDNYSSNPPTTDVDGLVACSSTSRLFEAFKINDHIAMHSEMNGWEGNVGDPGYNGLMARRQRERDLFIRDSQTTHIDTNNDGVLDSPATGSATTGSAT